MALTSKYPSSFFPIENPSSPWAEIQFRTKINVTDDIASPAHWTSITMNPSDFFNNLVIEDAGGAQQLTLNLYDKNFANLENLVVKSLLAARLANNLVSDPNYSSDKTQYFQFFISKASSVNLRLRIGYSQWNNSDNPYVDTVDSNSQDWLERINNDKPVIRTPWLYFQMSGADFSLKEDGEHVTIKAFSITGNFLDKAKMLQKYAKLTGTPVDILTNIEKIIKQAAAKNGDNIKFTINSPTGYKTRDGGEEIIEVMLGGVPDYRTTENGTKEEIPQYKSLRQLLDEVCSKIRPIIYDKSGNLVQPTQDAGSGGDGLNEENSNMYRTVPYGYSIYETSNSAEIIFYYKDPGNALQNQGTVRTYPWLAYGQSLLKDVSIESKTDFAILNIQVATINKDGGEMTVHVASGKDYDPNNNDTATDFTIGNVRDVSAAIDSEDFNAMFVTDVRETKQYEVSNNKLTSQQAAAILSRNIVTQLNNQVFEGSVTIPGDPFYLFDAAIQPFMYLIKLVIKRPNYVDSDGSVIDGGVSYLSGFYAIKKITHNIGTQGYDTILEVMKWPQIGQTQ